MAVHSKHTITAYNAHMLDGHHANEFALAGESGGSIIDQVYPIGAIYISTNNVEPSLLFGGVWRRWGQGRVPVSLDTDPNGTFTTLGLTGGSTELQAHSHSFTPEGTIADTTAEGTLGNQSAGHTHTISGGSVSITSSGSHTHVASKGSYKVGSGSGSTYTYFTNDGSTSPQSITSSGAHTHTVPAHSHTCGGASADHTHTFTGTAHSHTFTGTETTTEVTGDGASGNMPPYIVCNMWERVG